MKQNFNNNGYIILKNTFARNELKDLELIVDTVFNQWKVKNLAQIRNEGLINMNGLTAKAYFYNNEQARIDFFNLISHKNLMAPLRSILGDSIYFHDTQLFFNPVNIEQPPYWHRDFQYSGKDDEFLKKELGKLKALHVRVALASEKGVELVPGSHQRWDTELEREIRFELNGHKKHENIPSSKIISLDQGDVLVFDAQMLHKGCYKGNDNRKAFDICVGTPHPLPVSGLNSNFLPEEKDLINIKNSSWFSNSISLSRQK